MNEMLGQRLRRLRMARGMTIIALANAVGVGESTIRQIDRGNVASPSLLLGLRIAAALKVDPYELAGMERWRPSRPRK